VLNYNINRITVISWWSDLLIEDTRVPGENNQPAVNNKLLHT